MYLNLLQSGKTENMFRLLLFYNFCFINILNIICIFNSTDFEILLLKIHPIKIYYYPKDPNFIQCEYNSDERMLSHKYLVIGYRSQKPFVYYDHLKNEFSGIESKIIKMFAERKNLSIKTVECLDVASCEK